MNTRCYLGPYLGILMMAVALSGCDRAGFSLPNQGSAGPAIQRKLGLVAPVPLKPAKAFSGQRHLGLEILTVGYDRVPYFVSAPSKTTVTLEPCQGIYLAGDPDGKQSMQLDNFLLVEIAQGGRKQAVVLGDIETVRYLGKEVPHIGPDSHLIPAGMPRLDKVIKPGEPVDITVTALSNQDMGGVGPIYLIIEKPVGQGGEAQNCGTGQSDFVTEGRRALQKQATPNAPPVYKTPQERAKSFKTMSVDNIPGARPPLSNGSSAPPPMPATPVEMDVIPGSKGMPPLSPEMKERMRSFRSTPAPDKPAVSDKKSPVMHATPQPASKPIPTPVTKPTVKPDSKGLAPPPSPAPKPVKAIKPVENDIPPPKIIVPPRVQPGAPGATGATPAGQPALGSVIKAGKIVVRKEGGKTTETFIPAEKPDPDKKDKPAP